MAASTADSFGIPNMAGGMNDGSHASAIADNQFAEMYNYVLFGGKVRRRGDIANVVRTAGPAGAIFNSLFLYSYAQNKAVVIIGADVGLFKLEIGIDSDHPDVKVLPATGAFSAGTLNYPWTFVQVNGIGYGIRRGVGVRRFTRDFHSPAGITPPGWAPTIAQSGSAGVVEAGVYYAVATYRNSRTNAESDPGPAGGPLTQGASKKIDWSGLQPSNDSQVDQIRLWRTLANQTDTYFLVDEVGVGETTYSDNKTASSMGGIVSNDNGLPPDTARGGCIWDDTLALHDGRDVYISEILLPESFSDNILNAYRDDGAEIRGLCAWGSKLVVGKTNKMHYFTRTAERTFVRKTLDERNGCASQRSMKVIGQYLYWFSGNSKNICRSSGYGSDQVVTTEIRALLDRYVPGDPDTGTDELISAVVVPERNLYILSLPLDGATHNTHSIAYNYHDNTFTVWDYASGKAPLDVTDPSILDPIGGDLLANDLLSVFGDNRVYRFTARDRNLGLDDYSSGGDIVQGSINARFKTKMFNKNGVLMNMRQLSILADLGGDARGADFNAKLYLNGQSEAYDCKTFSFRTSETGSGTVAPDDDEPGRDGVPTPWKFYNFGNIQDLAELLQVEIIYTGKPAIEISQMALGVGVFSRAHKVAYGVPCGTEVPPRPEPPAPDVAISNVAICRVHSDEIGTESVTITWDTNTVTTANRVDYGPTEFDYSETEPEVGGDGLHHSVTILAFGAGGAIELESSTKYRIFSDDAQGPPYPESGDNFFSTIWTFCS